MRTADDRKLKLLHLSEAELIVIIRDSELLKHPHLPPDTKLLNGRWDSNYDRLVLYLWSSEFEDVPVGEVPSEVNDRRLKPDGL